MGGQETVEVWVDGSFCAVTRAAGAGMVISVEGRAPREYSCPLFGCANPLDAELLAAMVAMRRALRDRGCVGRLVLYSDAEGLCALATGRDARRPSGIRARFAQAWRDGEGGVNLAAVKVRAHVRSEPPAHIRAHRLAYTAMRRARTTAPLAINLG